MVRSAMLYYSMVIMITSLFSRRVLLHPARTDGHEYFQWDDTSDWRACVDLSSGPTRPGRSLNKQSVLYANSHLSGLQPSPSVRHYWGDLDSLRVEIRGRYIPIPLHFVDVHMLVGKCFIVHIQHLRLGPRADAGVTARRRLEVTSWRFVSRFPQVPKGRAAKTGELRGASRAPAWPRRCPEPLASSERCAHGGRCEEA
jgi:hypothetical protein